MWGVYYVTMMYAKLKTHLHTADDLKTGQQSQIPRILWILQPNGSPHLALLGGWHQNNLETLTEQTSKFGKNVTPFLPRNFTKIPGFTPTPGPTKFSGQHLPASLVKDSTGRGFPLLASPLQVGVKIGNIWNHHPANSPDFDWHSRVGLSTSTSPTIHHVSFVVPRHLSWDTTTTAPSYSRKANSNVSWIQWLKTRVVIQLPSTKHGEMYPFFWEGKHW